MRASRWGQVLGLTALVAAGPAHAQPAPERPAARPAVVVVGEAVVRRAPDRAFVDVLVESRAQAPREAVARNARVMAAVQERLRGAGLPAEAIETRGYELQEEVDYVEGRRVSRGYVARNRIEVRVDQLDRLGDVIDLAVAAGAGGIGGVRFDLRDRAAAEREALRRAAADA
ncbi:MAG TPA: SIMPL domain-containing protein, partial [Vicinamibacterales bacterium]|nr:SIMPL domain-containing protein [Vicinamibacterales bacterium]